VPLARAQIAHFAKLLGPSHHNVVYGWVNLARALHGSGDDAEALDAVKVAEEILRGANLPSGHPDFARTELIRGQIAASMGNRDEAERRLRNALAIRRARLAPGSTHTADAATALGDLLVEQQRLAAAESLYVAALGPYRRTFGVSDPRTLRVQRHLQSICESGRRPVACAMRDSATVPPAR
jgi:tetratricopeptide (TPR) repeat protein